MLLKSSHEALQRWGLLVKYADAQAPTRAACTGIVSGARQRRRVSVDVVIGDYRIATHYNSSTPEASQTVNRRCKSKRSVKKLLEKMKRALGQKGCKLFPCHNKENRHRNFNAVAAKKT
jgi:hypothetical protein